jgi:hypothetical protein
MAWGRNFQILGALLLAGLMCQCADSWIFSGATQNVGGTLQVSSYSDSEKYEYFFIFSGQAALVLLLIANIYLWVKIIRACFAIANPKFNTALTKLLGMHIVLNLIAVGFVYLHGHYAPERPNSLRIGFILMIWLSLAGFVMKLIAARGEFERQMKLMLYTQRALACTALGLMIVGHILVFM